MPQRFIENGDLVPPLSKNDAYNYMGDLYKTGRVRVSLTPNPFKAGASFRQTLELSTGAIRIEADGITLRIWVDALARFIMWRSIAARSCGGGATGVLESALPLAPTTTRALTRPRE